MAASQRPGGAGRLALVTGGAGFIGSHVALDLLANGWQVRVFDDFSTGRPEHLAKVSDRIEIVRADVCDGDALESAAREVDVVFHQAAIASVPRSLAEPLRCHGVNLGGTLHVLEAARRQRCRRVVFASSSAVYGATRDGSSGREDAGLGEHEAPRPLSPYAVQKLAAEHYLAVYAALHGIETVALRYFNVYGERQDPRGDYAAVIPAFALAALAGAPIQIHGDGLQTRDFVHVSDVARANRLAADAPRASGRVFNVASGRATSVLELASLLGRLLGPLRIERTAARRGDVRESVASIDAARAELAFESQVDLESGLRATLETFSGGTGRGAARSATPPAGRPFREVSQ